MSSDGVLVYAPRQGTESASPYLVCNCPPEQRATVDALARRWGLVPLEGGEEAEIGEDRAALGPEADASEAEPWSAAGLGVALEEIGCSFSLFLAAAGELDNYLWLYTPALGRFESVASADGSTVLVRADELDKALADAAGLEEVVRAVEALTGRAHRQTQEGLPSPPPDPLAAVRIAAQEYELARRRRDAAVAAVMAMIASEGSPADAPTQRELARAANISVGRLRQITDEG